MKRQCILGLLMILCVAACNTQTGNRELLTVLNPKSWVEPFNAVPLNPRPDSLSGKTIVVMVDPAYKHGRSIMVEIRDGLEEKLPDAEIVWIEEESQLRTLQVAAIDALAVGAGT
jgi:hypothetical protein